MLKNNPFTAKFMTTSSVTWTCKTILFIFICCTEIQQKIMFLKQVKIKLFIMM